MRSKFTISQKDLKKIYSPIGKKLTTIKQSVSPSRMAPISSEKRSQSITRRLKTPISINKNFKTDLVYPKTLNNFDSWKLINGHTINTKVFIIEGCYPDLKNSLIERGWVENPDSSSSNFNLLWTRTGKFPKNLHDWQIINHFPKNIEISAKWNFCENIKRLKKTFKVDQNIFFPRCFKLSGRDLEDFEDYFKAIKAACVLKNYVESNVGLYEKIVASIGICKRWVMIIERENAIKEKPISIVLNSEWRILNSNSSMDLQIEFKKFYAGKTVILPQEILSKAKETLRRLEQADRQFYLNGTSNIWIVKPGKKSRGREIRLFNSIEEIKKYTQNPQQWIVQKYIENPLLINKKKFDIRQWVLVTNSEPLTIWIYNSSYLRFSVEDYDVNDLQNLFVHLTNNSISKKSKHFSLSNIEGCMWNNRRFSEYLKEKYNEDVWQEQIFPRIKDIVKWSLFSVGNLGRKNSFEILGYDFMIDDRMNVWLIEVNSSPAMDYSTVSFS